MGVQTDAVIALIISQIDAGDILPGAMIDEKDVMRRCGVSRTPVREAMIRLETEGLVQKHARKGTILFKPTVPEFLSILEVHANLESFATGLAAQRITDAQKNELTACVAACETHVSQHIDADPAGYYQLNLHFHEIIVRAACNDNLSALVKTNARKLMAYYRLRYRSIGATAASAKEHRQIADHILAHRSTDAAAAMQQHFNYDRQTIMDLIASVG